MYLERVPTLKMLGVWVTWSTNCQEICIKAYSRISMLTKLKYVGVSIEDLLDIYILYIRSVAEYCSVAFHSSLSQADIVKIERIQKTCLKVFLGDIYLDYGSALEMSNLDTLYSRRTKTGPPVRLRRAGTPKVLRGAEGLGPVSTVYEHDK